MSTIRRLRTLLTGQSGVAVTGYLLALGSAAAVAATPIVRKTVSADVNPPTFSVWWYGLAGTYAWLLVLLTLPRLDSVARGEVHGASGIRRGWRPTLALVLANAGAAILYYTQIDLANPAIVSFFGRLRTVYVVLLGVVLLGERLGRQEWIGAAVTVLGTALIAYQGGEVLSLVLLLAVLGNLLFAIATVMAKFAVRHIPPITLVGYRGLLISVLILVYALIAGQWQTVTWHTLFVMAAGALGGPFLGHVMYYAALERVGAGRVAIITALQPVFVTLYTALVFGTLPTTQQALGGALTIGGVVLVFAARLRQPRADSTE